MTSLLIVVCTLSMACAETYRSPPTFSEDACLALGRSKLHYAMRSPDVIVGSFECGERRFLGRKDPGGKIVIQEVKK